MFDPWGASRLAGAFADVLMQADPTNPIAAFGSYGIAGVFISLWWVERKDRKDSDQRQRELFERVFPLIETLRDAIDVLKGAGKGP